MKTYKVNWTSRAIEQLIRSHDYIANNLKETNAARNLYNKIMKFVSGLKYFPTRYPDVSYMEKWIKILEDYE